MLETTRKALEAKRLREAREQERLAAKRRKELSKVYSEKIVAKHLVDSVVEAGGMIMKMHPLTNKGIPDYLIIYAGRVFFVETKTTGKTCEPAQIEFQKRLKQKGIDTYVLDTKVSNYYDIFTCGYKTYVDPDNPQYGINKLTKFRKL